MCACHSTCMSLNVIVNLIILYTHGKYQCQGVFYFSRLFGRHEPVSEAVSLRRFAEGRVEFLTTNTSESLTFCQAMDDCTITHDIKRKLFREAVNRHKLNILDVSSSGTHFAL